MSYSPWGLKELDMTERLHSQVKNKKTKKYTQALILSATPLLNHYKIPYQILPGKDKPFLWDMSLSCPPLPGKVIKLFIREDFWESLGLQGDQTNQY